MTRQPDFLDVVIMQGLCLSAGAEDAFTLHVDNGTVTVTWSAEVADHVEEWLDLDGWYEVVCLPLQWEIIDTWGAWWSAEAEVGCETVVAQRTEDLAQLLTQKVWQVPDVAPAYIVCEEIDLVGVSQVV